MHDVLIFLDVETTSLSSEKGGIIEIACIETKNQRQTGRVLHQYIKPQFPIEASALKIHGITHEFLQDKPIFAHIADTLIEFIQGATLVIHNAPFDVGFINAELSRLGLSYHTVSHYCHIIDSLAVARSIYPGQKNSLDALCRRHQINLLQERQLHNALLDVQLLAEVYFLMTTRQTQLFDSDSIPPNNHPSRTVDSTYHFVVVRASAEEQSAHDDFMSAYCTPKK